MYYVYLLQDSLKHIYIGYTSNLKQRFQSHLHGTNRTTAKFINPRLFYYESYPTENLARERERKLKQYGSSYTGLLKRLELK